MSISTYSESSQSFVRALKASTDPPQTNGATKIEIARAAWDNTSFYVPNKGELITDWILTRFLKDKAKDASANPLLDVRYWTLLKDVICQSGSLQVTQSTKAWLSPLLNRAPLAPIVFVLFNHLGTLEISQTESLCLVIRPCLSVLWLMGVQKITVDVLQDCFGAALEACGRYKHSDEHFTSICTMVSTSYRTSLSNAANKKKLYASFIQSHLANWIQCISTLALGTEIGQRATLLEDIYSAGNDTLFNLDALRQAKDNVSDDALFNILRTNIHSSETAVLAALPRLFSSFVQSTRKHRSALFSQASTQQPGRSVEDVKAAGIGFFTSCDSLLDLANGSELSWKTRTILLSIVDDERLFGHMQQNSQHILIRSRELAIDALETAWKSEQAVISNSAIDVLSALVRIDYDFLEPALSRVLPRIMIAAKSDTAISTFLELILDYHVKTRTVDNYISNLLTAISDPHTLSLSGGPRNAYQAASSGAVFNVTNLDHLSRYIRGFLTPSQSLELTVHIIQRLKEVTGQFTEIELQAAANAGESPRKKRRKSAPQATDQNYDFDGASVVYSLTSRISGLVLAALPFHAVPPSTHEELIKLLVSAYQSLHETTTSILQSICSEDRNESWAPHVVAAASLRLQYQIWAMKRIDHNFHHENGDLHSRMIEVTKRDETLPELVLEIFRNLFSHLNNREQAHDEVVLDGALLYLERHFTSQNIRWSGLSCHLSKDDQGRHNAALALLHCLVDRWLPLVDTQESKRSLDRLVKLILNISAVQDVPPHLESGLTPSGIVSQLMHSAHFWELPSIRNSFLSAISSKTAILDEIDLSKARSAKSLKKLKVDGEEIKNACFTYASLLFVPEEYYTRAARSDLVRRALTADAVVCLLLKDQVQVTQTLRLLTVVRVFMRRMTEYLNISEHSISRNLLMHLINPPSNITSPSPVLEEVTIDLVVTHLFIQLRSSDQSAVEAATTILSQFSSVKPFGQLDDQAQWSHRIVQSSILYLIPRLSDLSPSDVPRQSLDSLNHLHGVIRAMLAPQTSIYVEKAASEEVALPSNNKITAWSRLLSFGHWLGLAESDNSNLGQNIAGALVQMSQLSKNSYSFQPLSDDICLGTLNLLFEELQCLSEINHSRQLDIISAIYARFSGEKNSSVQIDFNKCVERACKTLTLQDFSHLLDVSYDGIASSGLIATERARLVSFSSVLLHNAPQGSLKVIQDFFTRCLNFFASYSRIDDESHLRSCTLEFIAQHCSDRPSMIRSSDTGNIWCLLSKTLSGSSVHDATTSFSTFHYITATISALIRLRRDLVVNTLPHLGVVLRRLIAIMRSPRPLLGAKQSKMVSDTLPAWINSSYPLLADEGRALGRLLTSLTNKTIPRTHTFSATSTDTQKAESLANPFAKHAAYVLTAYVDAINEPLCVLSADVRRELEPGLFSLCEMVSEHSRDAVMVSALDSGGKIVLKALWKEFEKQRYVGKG
ncbi:Urb2/Npa2 family-domain-containing protein [Hygrophoropsis aurantiaca]|uniref:Urb2/Npa2 family-domain-containing protein n=1 Tax=Hygrophoropsis aurantiaca TaxID=72124 RepID=A0ACB8AEG0_9AGAM|nr:Urb2/Npa2 family-domain-containing protein [Hygrophoropsis aurantiaca]